MTLEELHRQAVERAKAATNRAGAPYAMRASTANAGKIKLLVIEIGRETKPNKLTDINKNVIAYDTEAGHFVNVNLTGTRLSLAKTQPKKPITLENVTFGTDYRWVPEGLRFKPLVVVRVVSSSGVAA